VDYLKSVPDKEEWFIYPDLNHCFKFSEMLKGMGFQGIFPTEEDRIMEVDRDEAKKFVAENYPMISQNEVQEFSTIDEARDFLEDAQEIYVLKGKDEDAPTIVPKSDDPELAKQEILAGLELNIKDFEKSGFILEMMIKDAVEITPQAVWNNGQLVYMMVDIEAKPKGAGDVGELTGCSTDLIFWIDQTDYIAKVAFPEVVWQMAKEHEGVFFWDASLLISRNTGKIYFGEFCANRPGYNCIYSELSNLNTAKEYFDKLEEGVNPFDNRKANFSGSVRIFSQERQCEGESVYPTEEIGIIWKGDDNYWLMDGRQEDDKIITCGYLEDLAVITGQGDTITDLAENLYNNLKNFTFEAKKWTYRCRDDYTSTGYNTSLVNRFEYGNHIYYEQPDFNEDADKKQKAQDLEKQLEEKYKNLSKETKQSGEIDKFTSFVNDLING